MNADKILHIVERAYEGTIEEQDDQILWLVAAMRGGGGTNPSLLLRGSATNYAVKGHDPSGFSVGGLGLGHPPRIDEDVKKHLGAGTAVYVVREDAEARGIEAGDLVEGVKLVARTELAGLVAEHSAVFAW